MKKFNQFVLFTILVLCFVVSADSTDSAEVDESSLSPPSKLMCYCDACNETNFLCETNGACFISRETINGTYQISQRCYNNDTSSHFEYPTICTKFYEDKYSVKCCSTDLCNDEDVLPPKTTNDQVLKPRIKCHCSFCGSSSQFTCETDGVCFLSWKQMNNELKYSQSCYDKKHFFPPDTPSFCELRNYDDYGRMCCDQDYCNSQGFRKEEVKFNAFALIFFIAFLLSVAFVVYQNWN